MWLAFTWRLAWAHLEGPSVSPPTFTTSLGLPPQPSHCSLKHKTNGGQECPQPGVQPRVLISLALHR